MQVKRMPYQQFIEVMKREWTPVRLVGDAIPEWLRGIPCDIMHSVYASGTLLSDVPYSGTPVPSGLLIGGIDVYRNAPDDPVDLNKDWYPVITLPETDSMLLLAGPIKDAEHWLDEVPDQLEGVEVLVGHLSWL